MIAWHVYDGEPFGHQRAIAVDGDTNFCQRKSVWPERRAVARRRRVRRRLPLHLAERMDHRAARELEGISRACTPRRSAGYRRHCRGRDLDGVHLSAADTVVTKQRRHRNDG